jgi:adenine-specific DNA-methyltransferase
MTTLNGKTPDLAKEKIKKLKAIFPDIFEEGKIDFSKLKQDLGEYVDDEKERYNFSWNGKGRALRLSQTPSAGTLRPCPEESKNWGSTKNLYIEGDNLEVLKLLQKSYHGKVKMIYIDPPYNTGNDFVYPDNFTDSIENYKEITGQVNDEGHAVSTNSEANGRYHTDWLNMMYPRLRLARNLLTDDGVIFISIDDNEAASMKKICDEVFGEQNYIGIYIKQSKVGGGSDTKFIVKEHEYCVVYAKDINFTSEMYISHDEDYIKRYKEEDANGRFFWDTFARPGLKHPIHYDIVAPDGTIMNYGWIHGKERYEQELKEGLVRIVPKSGDGWSVQFKQYLNLSGKKPRSMTMDFGGSIEGKSDIDSLFESEKLFSYPKSVKYLKTLFDTIKDNNAVVLDFFSGSATTAHAAMQLNAEDGGSRRFIMVQLPEPCPKDSEAAKAGYKNICEIGKERIRRAGEKIKTEVEEQNTQLKLDEVPKKVPDIGFQVFKLDSSNLKKWNTEAGMTADFVDGSEQLNFSAEKLAHDLQAAVENYIPGRTEQDVVYEILLKMGFDLTWPVEEKVVAGKKVYVVALGALMLCLENDITPDVARGMAELHKQLAPETWKVVFRDNGFASDSDKVNVHEILKSAGLEEDAFTTV